MDEKHPDNRILPELEEAPRSMRPLLILEELARLGVPATPTEVNRRLALPKQTLHRIFSALEVEGFIQRDLDGRCYGPGRRLRAMAVNTISSERLRTARLAILKAVAEEVGETCNLAVPDREGMTYLDRVETKWPLRIQLPIGTQVPFHCTASGKMYLSTLRASTLESVMTARPLEQMTPKTITLLEEMGQELKLTRERGYSTDDEEFMTGMAAIAVPILDPQDRLMATLSVHAPVQRHSLSEIIGFYQPLRRAADLLAKSVQ